MSVGPAGRARARRRRRRPRPTTRRTTSCPSARAAATSPASVGDGAVVDGAALVGDRRRPDLDDDAHVTSRYSKLKSPIHTTSPSAAPARASSLLTPRRSRRWLDVGRGVRRRDVVERDDPLDVAAADAELVLALALDGRARRHRAQQHDAVALRLGCARASCDERGPSPRRAGRAPSPVTAEITKRVSPSGANPSSAGSVVPVMSAFVPTTSRGRSSSSGRYAPSSSSRTRSCSAGRRAVERGEVDEQAQHAGPLDVAQELVAEAAALAGALDEAGDVGDDELGGVVEAHDAEVRLERRERVVGDLRLGRRDHADQRALADVGEADEGDVGHQLQLELEPALLAVLALLGEARRPAPVAEELGVAAPAPPAGGGQPAVAVVQQLGEHLAACRGP